MEGRSSRANGKFCEIRSDQFCKKLEQCAIFLESNDFTPIESKKIIHIIAEDGYLLPAIKVYRALWGCRKNILYAHPEDGQDMRNHMVETFLQPEYVYLVMILPKIVEQSETAWKQIGKKLREALELHDKKKVILIADRDDGLVQQLRLGDEIFQAYHTEGTVAFKDLTIECRGRLRTRQTILFQGKKVSLEKLFRPGTGNRYEAALHGDLLERLVRGETIRVGSELRWPEEPPENCYISRILKIGDKEITESDVLCETEKVVLITGDAGSGKSAFLAKLAADVKSKSSSSWVVLVNLADFTTTLKECQTKGRDAISLEELLSVEEATKPATPFDEFVFRRKESVVLMLDGIDEVFPEYERLVLGLLDECREAPHISKVVITARPHVVELLEAELGVVAYTLQPFTRDDLKEFLVARWMYRLKLQTAGKKKCETYATELMKQVFPSAIDDHFVAAPLGAKVLAELFERSDPDSVEWEGCEEYLDGDKANPKLSQWLIGKLVERFIEEMRTVFMDRANPSGNRTASQALDPLYKECVDSLRILAVDEVLNENEEDHELFLGTRQIDETLEPVMLQIGFVQKSNDKLRFAYKGIKEFFFTEILLKALENGDMETELQEYFVKNIFSSAKFKDVRAFLNKALKGVVDSLPSDLFEINQSGLVHQLAKEGFEAILELVFKYTNDGIDVNATDWGWTALHNAAWLGHLAAVKFLVQEGADVNYKSNTNRTPLHSAAVGGHWDIVKFLVEREADVNLRENSGRTALHFAAEAGHLATVELLVEHLADVDIKTNYLNQTALHYAVRSGHLDIVKFLVEEGAKLDIKDCDGKTPLGLATINSHLDIVKFLSYHGS